jgi:3-deoxy-D-manno-octulosonic-acid transferase
MRLLYTLICIIALPFTFVRLYWRGRKNPNYRKHWAERLGFSKLNLPSCIWVHAVSLGETIAAEPMVQRLLTQYPNDNIVLTSLTPTGRARAANIKHARIFYCHLPYDLPSLLNRFIRRVHPKALIIMETELWPNLMAVCQSQKIPVILANARMSERSARGYQRIPSLTRPMLESMQVVAVQNEADCNRLIHLGLPQAKAIVTGSIKFDLTIPEAARSKGHDMKAMWAGRLSWIAASTHPGEEEQILAAHREILKQIPNALLVLVPRHPERFAAVQALCQQQGFTVVNRSNGQPCSADIQVYLGDTMGELLAYYAAVDIAYVGGSLVATGGHNTLEPAALSLPVITGPHTFNFAQISKLLLNANAAITVTDSSHLAAKVLELMQNPNLRQTMGEQAAKVVEANRGALDRLMALIGQHI